jgi:hypothetical protein
MTDTGLFELAFIYRDIAEIERKLRRPGTYHRLVRTAYRHRDDLIYGA